MTVRFKTGIAISLLCALAIVVAGCRSKNEVYQPKVNPEFLSLSKEEIFAKGEELYSRDKWAKCREYFSYVYENFPNDPLARRSLLRIADAYRKQGREVDLVEAQYKYRDFINRFPSSELADYATIQIANVAFLQMENLGPIRLTIDRGLGCCLLNKSQFPCLSDYKSILAGKCVVELKYREVLPTVFRELIQEFKLMSQPVSKFRNAIAVAGLLYPT